MKREHKAAKTLGIIMGCFIICWLPFFCWYTTTNVFNLSYPPILEYLLFWIGYSNSTLNPLIYASFNSEFREAFRQLLTCCGRRCNSVSAPPGHHRYSSSDGGQQQFSRAPIPPISANCKRPRRRTNNRQSVDNNQLVKQQTSLRFCETEKVTDGAVKETEGDDKSPQCINLNIEKLVSRRHSSLKALPHSSLD